MLRNTAHVKPRSGLPDRAALDWRSGNQGVLQIFRGHSIWDLNSKKPMREKRFSRFAARAAVSKQLYRRCRSSLRRTYTLAEMVTSLISTQRLRRTERTVILSMQPGHMQTRSRVVYAILIFQVVRLFGICCFGRVALSGGSTT